MGKRGTDVETVEGERKGGLGRKEEVGKEE